MEISPEGKVVSHRIAKTAIRSCHRLTYTNVNRMLEEGDEALIEKIPGYHLGFAPNAGISADHAQAALPEGQHRF